MKLDLSDVTVCAADSVNVALSARALTQSMDLCQFGDALLFTDAAVSGPFKTVPITPLRSKTDYNTFVLKDLPQHIRTPFALVIQWDGYVLDAGAWRPEFRHYDYIGARWPWHNDGLTVGNGGFSLRSKKLLEATTSPHFQFKADAPEDNLICRVNRGLLESQFGLKFAPEKIADQFAYERAAPQGPVFGFHGLFNFWRHISDDDLLVLAGSLGPHIVQAREFSELVLAYFELGKATPFKALYGRLRQTAEPADLRQSLFGITNNQTLAHNCVQVGESLLAQR